MEFRVNSSRLYVFGYWCPRTSLPQNLKWKALDISGNKHDLFAVVGVSAGISRSEFYKKAFHRDVYVSEKLDGYDRFVRNIIGRRLAI